jgi:two-component system chemotaxis response regulator CheB
MSGQTRKKVLIVDDSLAMRGWLRTVLSTDIRLEIAGEAANAIEARDFLRAHRADVVTLDIEMPGMSGLDFLTRLMIARPMPVVMMSGLTIAGSDAAVQALSRGAVDCIAKPTDGYGSELSRDICERIYQASCVRASQLRSRAVDHPVTPAPCVGTPKRLGPCRRGGIILIGASTGGVAALETVLPMLDPVGPPVVIVQHMPGNFLASFSERLDKQLRQRVMLAREGVALERGDIVMAPGAGQHTALNRVEGQWFCRFLPNQPPALHCPAIDVLFRSAVSEAKHVSAALLTGLGKDGADGLRQLAENGARTFGQNEDTCVVYGMPRAAKLIGAVQAELPIGQIGMALRTSRGKKRAPLVRCNPVGQ